MALINRFTRLFRADLHAVLDRIEEPEILLRQSVREMTQSLEEDQRNLKIMEHDLAGFPALIADAEQQLTQVQDEINLCLDSGNDKLARSKVRRKLELSQRSKRLQARQAGLDKEVAALREQLGSNEQRLESMRQKLEIFTQEIDRHAQSHPAFNDVMISEDDVDVALLQEKKQHGSKSGGGK